MKKIVALLLTLALLITGVPFAISETGEIFPEETVLTAEVPAEAAPSVEEAQEELPVPEALEAPAEATEATAEPVAEAEIQPEAEASEAPAAEPQPELPAESAGEAVPPEAEEILPSEEQDAAADAAPEADESENAMSGTLANDFIYSGTTLLEYRGNNASVEIPDDITTIGDSAFKNNRGIIAVTFPDGINEIRGYAFAGCTALDMVYFPSNSMKISTSAFDANADFTACVYQNSSAHVYCKENLKKVTIHIIGIGTENTPEPPSDPSVSSTPTPTPTPTPAPYPDFVVDNNVLIRYTGSASSVRIPSTLNIASIGMEAFAGNAQIEEVVIPNTIASIGKKAFENCVNLENITLPNSLGYISHDAFFGCEKLNAKVYSGSYAETFCVHNKIPHTPMDCTHKWKVTYSYQHKVTCAAPGYANIECELCGETERYVVYTPEHEWSDTFANSDCIYKFCFSCGKISSSDVSASCKGFPGCAEVGIDAKGKKVLIGAHKGLKVETSIEASCTEPGYQGSIKCTVCNTVIREGTIISAHTLTEIPAVEATCISTGSTAGLYCENCKKYLTEPEILPMTEHEFEAKITKESTCIEQGEVRLVCKGCGFTHESITYLPIADHTPETAPNKAPTCTETGLTGGTICSVCKTVLAGQSVIPAMGHSAVSKAGKPATCTETGLTEGAYCCVCNLTLIEQSIIPLMPHTEITIPGKEATETETGLTEGTRCGVCGKILVEQQIIPMLLPGFDLTRTGSNGSCSIAIGEVIELRPVFAEDKGWAIKQWRSSSSRVAIVEDGVVEALDEGNATITVTTTNGKRATFKISVYDPTAPSDILFGCPDSIKISVGEEFYIETEVLPETAEYELSFKSSRTKYMTVDEDGMITGVDRGSGKITVTAKNENGASVSKTISVKVLKEPTKLELSYNEGTLVADGDTFTLKADFGSSSRGAMVYWSSSDEDVLTVDQNGLLTPISKGVAVITAETFNGLSDTCIVTVTGEPAEIYLDEIDLEMSYKQTFQLEPLLLDEDGEECRGKISYESSHPKNVYVSSSGKITIKKSTKGVAEIILTSENGLTTSVYVTVVAAPSKITLEETEIELIAGAEYQIDPILPEDTVATITYYSHDDDVAIVDEEGLVTAVAEGSTRISVKTQNGKKVTLKVTVIDDSDEDDSLTDEGLIGGKGDVSMYFGKSISALNGDIDDPLTKVNSTGYANDYFVCIVNGSGKITALGIMDDQESSSKYTICGVYLSMKKSTVEDTLEDEGWTLLEEPEDSQYYVHDDYDDRAIAVEYSGSKVVSILLATI